MLETLVSSSKEYNWMSDSGISDSARAQKWQDNQGETINHNLCQLRTLADRIDDDVHQQLKRLNL
jgi:hypothetical protein